MLRFVSWDFAARGAPRAASMPTGPVGAMVGYESLNRRRLKLTQRPDVRHSNLTSRQSGPRSASAFAGESTGEAPSRGGIEAAPRHGCRLRLASADQTRAADP